MEILNILMGYGPILFSGAVIGGLISFAGPELINKLKANFNHQRVLDLYRDYEKNSTGFSEKHPALGSYFGKESWKTCECPNCRWLTKKVSKEAKKA